MNSWEVVWENEAEKDLSRIDRTTARKIKEKVADVLVRNP
jgi:mRNA-degrading endonuclease RelE of RelBE toxin-antitoxin system